MGTGRAILPRRVSLGGFALGVVVAGVLLWPQMRPSRTVETLVEMRGIDVSVSYRWGWPVTYRKTIFFERYGQLPEDRWAEHYPDSLSWGRAELHANFPEYDIEGWVDSRQTPSTAWDLPGEWYIGMLVVDAALILTLSVVASFVFSRLIRRTVYRESGTKDTPP